jgi:hypothetical protein
MTTVTTLIERSAATDSVVHADYTDELADALETVCEASVENGPVTEYWGCDSDGDTWRVHLDMPQALPFFD